MPRMEDYKCSTCGFAEVDVYFSLRSEVTPDRPCKCGQKADRVFAHAKQNFIHSTHSSMYGKYEPGLGQVVESYGHKQHLMREMGVQESSDPTGGSRCYQKTDPGPLL